MLQGLLADRFHLTTRRETRQLPCYELVVSKKGPKLKPGDPSEQWSEGSMKGGIFSGGIELHQLTMRGLAEVLGGKIGRPVIDKTDLVGAFDVTLKWAPEKTIVSDANTDGPSLYTVLEEQLGLKLLPTKAPIEVLVITRIERPSAN